MMQRRVVSRGAIAVACGLWLAGTSTAAAQTASAGSPAPPPAQLPRPESSVVEVPELLRFQFVPKFVTGIPVGPFGKKVGASPGAAVDFTARVGQTPVSVGAAFGYLLYGTETRRLAVFPAVPEVFTDVGTTNNLIRTHALVRVQSPAGRVRPYAEGLLGFSYVYTRTSVDLGNDGGGAGTTHLGDFAPSVGAGGGVTIALASLSNARLGLDIGLRYLTGGEVDYLTRGELQRDETGVTFEPTRSLATLFDVQIGITVDF